MGSNREQKKNFEKLPLFVCKCEKIQNITKNRKKIQNKYVYTTVFVILSFSALDLLID